MMSEFIKIELLTRRNQVPVQPASNSAQDTPASVEISQSAEQSQAGDATEQAQDPTLDASSDDVIAIEDLDKVRADPQATDDNPN